MNQIGKVKNFDQGLRSLQEEREVTQKKKFTKWINSLLQQVHMEVDDLFVDLADGRKLLKLLEIISGEKLAKPNNGKMRIHKIENVNKSLAFLHTKVRLEGISAEDIVDGNPRLILGFIWTIFSKIQVPKTESQHENHESLQEKSANEEQNVSKQEIQALQRTSETDFDANEKELKTSIDPLLTWARIRTHGYSGVNICDFSTSWRNGLAFNALIHSHRPNLVDYNSLLNNRNIDNLNHAFYIANKELDIPQLLDAEDVANSVADEKNISRYVSLYYDTFAWMKNGKVLGDALKKKLNEKIC